MRLIITLLCLCISSYAFAASPVIFSRSNLTIHSQSNDEENKQTEHTFTVEIKSPQLLENQNFFSLPSLSATHAIMIAYPNPTDAPITYQQIFTPLDILVIDRHGEIIKILPNLVLSQLQQDVLVAKPYLALLFLQSGIAETSGIKPKNLIKFKLFQNRTVVLQ
jgi:uncharacterized membrane protein (UPF0127 family)